MDAFERRTGLRNTVPGCGGATLGGGFAALERLKQQGQVRAVSAGINRTGMIPRFLTRYPLDFFLVAMP